MPNIVIGPNATNPNCRRIHVDGQQWCKVYGFDTEMVEARAQAIVDALSAVAKYNRFNLKPSPPSFDIIKEHQKFADAVEKDIMDESNRIEADSSKFIPKSPAETFAKGVAKGISDAASIVRVAAYEKPYR